MNEKSHFDVVVIGTGPGGEGAAMQAIKSGKTCAAVEMFHRIGGNCTHMGTIPSKALRYAVAQLTEISHNPLVRETGVSLNFSFRDLRRSERGVIERQVEMRRGFYDRNRIPVVHGKAHLVDAHTVAVLEANGGSQMLSADFIGLAPGSRPFRPPNVDFSPPRIFDSDTILTLPFTPQSITIYGAGVVGCEYT